MRLLARPLSSPSRRFPQLAATAFLVLIVVIGPGTFAVAMTGDDLPADLVRLVENLRSQIGRTYRLNHYARDRQLAQVERAVRSWHSSARNVRDEKLLAAWLRDAMRRSVPVRRLPLLPVPVFAHRSSPPPGLDRPPTVLQPGSLSNQIARQPSPTLQVFRTTLENSPSRDTREPTRGTHPILSRHQPTLESKTPKRPPPRRVVIASIPATRPNIGFTEETFVSRPRIAVESTATLHPGLTTAPDVAPTSSAQRSATVVSASGVNLAEYRARAVGYRRGLRHIEAQLVSGDTLTSRKLMKLALELDALADQRKMLAVYSNLLGGAGPRNGAQLLPSLGPARKLLRKAVQARRDALRVPGIVPTLQARQLEQSILSAIEQQATLEPPVH